MGKRWLASARCREPEADPEAWFPQQTPTDGRLKELCGDCPVIQQCAAAWLEDRKSKTASVGCVIAGVYIPETGKMKKSLEKLINISSGVNKA